MAEIPDAGGSSKRRRAPSGAAAVPGGSSQRFPRVLRVRKRREFLKVQGEGLKVTNGPLLGLALPNGLAHPRLGLTVSSTVGNAVVRARIRRHLREAFRTQRALVPPGLDLVLIARKSAAEADGAALRRAFEQIARKLKEPSR